MDPVVHRAREAAKYWGKATRTDWREWWGVCWMYTDHYAHRYNRLIRPSWCATHAARRAWRTDLGQPQERADRPRVPLDCDYPAHTEPDPVEAADLFRHLTQDCTPRQREVANLMVAGYSLAEAAEELGVTKATAQTKWRRARDLMAER